VIAGKKRHKKRKESKREEGQIRFVISKKEWCDGNTGKENARINRTERKEFRGDLGGIKQEEKGQVKSSGREAERVARIWKRVRVQRG